MGGEVQGLGPWRVRAAPWAWLVLGRGCGRARMVGRWWRRPPHPTLSPHEGWGERDARDGAGWGLSGGWVERSGDGAFVGSGGYGEALAGGPGGGLEVEGDDGVGGDGEVGGFLEEGLAGGVIHGFEGLG